MDVLAFLQILSPSFIILFGLGLELPDLAVQKHFANQSACYTLLFAPSSPKMARKARHGGSYRVKGGGVFWFPKIQ